MKKRKDASPGSEIKNTVYGFEQERLIFGQIYPILTLAI